MSSSNWLSHRKGLSLGVSLPCLEAVIEAAEEAVEQVALRGGVSIAGHAAPVVVSSGTGPRPSRRVCCPSSSGPPIRSATPPTRTPKSICTSPGSKRFGRFTTGGQHGGCRARPRCCRCATGTSAIAGAIQRKPSAPQIPDRARETRQGRREADHLGMCAPRNSPPVVRVAFTSRR